MPFPTAARILPQGRQFLRTFTWLISESVKTTPRLWRNMLLASAMTLASNAAVIAIIFAYIHLVERNAPVSVFGISTAPRESFLLLVLAVVAMILAALSFALSQYFARSNAIRAMGCFEKHCTVRAMELFSRLPDPRAGVAQQMLKRKKLIHLVRMDATHCGMAIKFIGFGVQSLLMLIFALLAMFVLDARATAIVCGLGLIIIAAQYPSNLFAATSTAVHTRTRAEVQEHLTGLLGRISRQPRWLADASLDRDIASFFEKAAARQHIAAAENRFRAIEISGLTTRIGGAVILGGMIMSFGASVIAGEVGWAGLTAYLALLRSALTSITAVFQTVTMVTRMYPQIQEFSQYVLNASRAESTPGCSGSTQRRTGFTLQALDADGEPSEVAIPLGAPVALAVPSGYGRETALDLHSALTATGTTGEQARAPTIDLALPAPEVTALDHLARRPYKASTGPLMEDALSRLADAGTDVILIDRRAIDSLEAGRWEHWQDRLQDRLLVIAYTGHEGPVADLGETLLILYQTPRDLTWRPRPPEGWPPIDMRSLLAAMAARSTRAGGEGSEDLLE